MRVAEPIISVSGLRGVVGESLTPDVAMRFVAAFAAELEPGPLVVTRDGRNSGRMLADAVRSALAAVGRDTIDADVAATPTTGVLVRSYEAAGGIQISASHNPAIYNGLKLFSPAGQVLSAEAGQRVIDRYRQQAPTWVPYDRIGSNDFCPDHSNVTWAWSWPRSTPSGFVRSNSRCCSTRTTVPGAIWDANFYTPSIAK